MNSPSQTSPPNFRTSSDVANRGAAAFSLVEVVLAIGIISFTFVAIFGLMPIGLNTFRQAIDNSLGSQIVQRIINEAQQTDYPTLIAQTAPALRYFDDQGNELLPEKSGDSIYTAEVTVLAPTLLPNASTPATASLATLTVKLANNPGHHPAPFAKESKISYATYSALIAKNQ